MSYSNFNVDYLNWCGARELVLETPKVGQITSNNNNYKLIESYKQICDFFSISIPVGGAVPNFGMDPQILVLMKHNKFRFD